MRKSQLSQGVKIESEHKNTIKFIRSYVQKNKKFPSNKQIYTSISKDHLKEHKNYYNLLRKAKL